MSFLESLAKGFVRSAVNQVGRDGGKIISNKVYGDRHSNPMRIVSNTYSQSVETPISNYKINSVSDLNDSGYKKELLESSVLAYFILFIGGFILPIFGPLYWFVHSIKNFFKRYNKFYQVTEEPNYVSDKRFKTGMRQEGYENVKTYSEAVSIPNSTERAVYISKGVIALAIGLFTGYCQYTVGRLMFDNEEPATIQSDIPKFKKKGFILSEKGLTLRKGPSGKSEKLDLVPFKDTLEILPDIGPEETLNNQTAKWIKVKYNDKEGWIWSGLVELDKKSTETNPLE